jgi:predicted amidophosphoribosyltransferase
MKAIPSIIDSDWVACPYCGKKFDGLEFWCPQCKKPLKWNITWAGVIAALVIITILLWA